MGTIISLFSIWLMTAYLLDQAITRLCNPAENQVIGKIMFIIACCGVVFNVIQISILHSGDLDSLQDHGHSHSHGDGHGHDEGKDDGHGHSHSHGSDEKTSLTETLVEAPEHNCGIEKIPKKDSDGKDDNINVEAAYLHILGDLLTV